MKEEKFLPLSPEPKEEEILKKDLELAKKILNQRGISLKDFIFSARDKAFLKEGKNYSVEEIGPYITSLALKYDLPAECHYPLFLLAIKMLGFKDKEPSNKKNKKNFSKKSSREAFFNKLREERRAGQSYKKSDLE